MIFYSVLIKFSDHFFPNIITEGCKVQTDGETRIFYNIDFDFVLPISFTIGKYFTTLRLFYSAILNVFQKLT